MKSLILVLIVATGLFLWLDGYHIVRTPTPDQRYGCTVAQQAPNGECQ